MAVVKVILFALLSIGIVRLSWGSLRNRRSHGFYRFFAFEAIFALTLINIDRWFSDPFSWMHILSWILLLGSLPLAIHAFYLLRKYGQSQGTIEQTVTLVQRGAYRYIRHPLYASLLLFLWGVFLKAPSLVTGLLAIVASLLLHFTAIAEERASRERFGQMYETYQQKTKRFIPFVY
jgi:protein-S-isoprenylcysteine O-methyltransferase Ste14